MNTYTTQAAADTARRVIAQAPGFVAGPVKFDALTGLYSFTVWTF